MSPILKRLVQKLGLFYLTSKLSTLKAEDLLKKYKDL